MGSPILRIEVSSTSLRMELSMSDTKTVGPLRQCMIDDMAARKLNPHTQRSHISSCKRFAAWLKRSPDTATPDEVRRFQLHLIESGASICNRNRIMTGCGFCSASQRFPYTREIFPRALYQAHIRQVRIFDTLREYGNSPLT